MPSANNKSQVIHKIPPVWNEQSRVLILGTMPSPKSRAAGFFYMHPQNRFWRVLPAVFGETLRLPNNPGKAKNAADIEAAVRERRQFLLDHKIALWDVLASCDIQGAADSSIKNAVPNDFSEIFRKAKIRRVFCAGQTAFKLWQKHCAALYEPLCQQGAACLPSPSPANAAWSFDRLLAEWKIILEWLE